MVFLMKLENQSKVWRKSLLHPNAAVTKNLKVKQSNRTRVLVNSIVAKIGKPYVLDSSGVYFIIPNIITAAGNQSYDSLDVTLCLQTTANHLHHLKDLSVTWDGPVSVAVFTYGKDTLFAVYSILYLYSCFESVHNTVSFHLIFPVNQAPANLVSISKLNFNCSGSDYLRLDKMRENYNIFSLPYPNNLLRNVAITNAKSDYILVLDIDMVPAKFLRKQFVDFIQRQAADKESNTSNNIAYIVPCFESKTEDLVAKSKQELIRDWNNHEVRPFYFEVCWKCQKATDYEQWRHSQSVDFTYLAYYVDWQDPWEPFYIAKRKSLPLYDERFKQYGFNRISQVSTTQCSPFITLCLGSIGTDHVMSEP